MDYVYILSKGSKFPKCVMGVFSTREEALIAKSKSKSPLRGPFQIPFGTDKKITSPPETRKVIYQYAIRKGQPEYTVELKLKWSWERISRPYVYDESDNDLWLIEQSYESMDVAKFKAEEKYARLEKMFAEQQRNAILQAKYREVLRWEEVERNNDRISKLIEDSVTSSKEDAMKEYEKFANSFEAKETPRAQR